MVKKLLLAFCLLSCVVTKAQNIGIPDPIFKNALVNLPCVDIDNDYTFDVDADSNNDGEISVVEALAVTSLQLPNQSIQSVEGLQYFTNLQLLNLFRNDLSQLDVSMLSQLRELDCSMNYNIHTLTLGNLPELEVFNCGNNQLTSLDLSQTPNLWFFTCQFNQFTELDLSGLPRLKTYQCDNNLFTSIDLTNHFELTSFWCFQNPLLNNVDVRNGASDVFTIFALNLCPLLETFCIDQGDTFSFGYDGPVASFCTLAVTENEAVKPINFYPNPTNDRLYFNASIDYIEIYNDTGRLVRNQTINGNSVDVSNLTAGIYMLHYNIGGVSALEKFIRK